MMRADQVEIWNRVARELDLAVVAPCELILSNGDKISATALVEHFGARKGMVVDPDWSTIAPHAERLVADGYGYSAVEISGDHASLIEILRDWGWSGAPDEKSWWVPATD